jgi:hypothetical protein
MFDQIDSVFDYVVVGGGLISLLLHSDSGSAVPGGTFRPCQERGRRAPE